MQNLFVSAYLHVSRPRHVASPSIWIFVLLNHQTELNQIYRDRSLGLSNPAFLTLFRNTHPRLRQVSLWFQPQDSISALDFYFIEIPSPFLRVRRKNT